METSRKLKPDRSISGPMQPVIVLTVFGISYFIFGRFTALYILSGFYLIYFLASLYLFARVKNFYYLLPGIFQILTAVFIVINPKGPLSIDPQVFKGFVIVYICSIFMAIYSLISKKLKWRGREILELAAQNVQVNPESYTERPRPAGKIDVSRNELFGFAGYYRHNLLGITKREHSKVIFLPVRMNQFENFLFNPGFNYRDKTHVTFDFDGNVSTFISKKDYLEYKEDLSFDHLSKSLGDLYLDFFHLYQKGEEVRIMDQLNEVRIHIFA